MARTAANGVTGTLTVTSNAPTPDSTYAVTLLGNAYAAPPPITLTAVPATGLTPGSNVSLDALPVFAGTTAKVDFSETPFGSVTVDDAG